MFVKYVEPSGAISDRTTVVRLPVKGEPVRVGEALFFPAERPPVERVEEDGAVVACVFLQHPTEAERRRMEIQAQRDAAITQMAQAEAARAEAARLEVELAEAERRRAAAEAANRAVASIRAGGRYAIRAVADISAMV